jgi:c-di-GMP-binding flagellar brake protein YcgR
MANDNIDKITGNSRLALLQLIKKESITVQLILTGHNFERLTIVADLKEEGGKSFVVVDCPDGFVEEIPNFTGAAVKVEFLGVDRVQYAFVSRVVRIDRTDLYLEMPEYVEKVQRRQFFRIAPPLGAKITISRIGRPQDASLINVSEGGALVVVKEHVRGLPKPAVGETLLNIRLRCVTENLQTEIKIGKATIVRVQTEPRSEQTACALEFLQMDPRERRLLQEFIFLCQREILRKRNELRKR